MEVEAAGHAVLSLVLDPATGAIVEAEGESVLEMTMRGRRRAQALRQSARITIRLEEPAARP
jgi:hypothetical protein